MKKRRIIPKVLRATVSRHRWARRPLLLAADRIEDPDRRVWCEGVEKDGSSLVKRSASETVAGGSWADMAQRVWIAIASWTDSRKALGGWNEQVWDMESWPWTWMADAWIGYVHWFKSAVQGRYRKGEHSYGQRGYGSSRFKRLARKHVNPQSWSRVAALFPGLQSESMIELSWVGDGVQKPGFVSSQFTLWLECIGTPPKTASLVSNVHLQGLGLATAILANNTKVALKNPSNIAS